MWLSRAVSVWIRNEWDPLRNQVYFVTLIQKCWKRNLQSLLKLFICLFCFDAFKCKAAKWINTVVRFPISASVFAHFRTLVRFRASCIIFFFLLHFKQTCLCLQSVFSVLKVSRVIGLKPVWTCFFLFGFMSHEVWSVKTPHRAEHNRSNQSHGWWVEYKKQLGSPPTTVRLHR